MVKKAPKCHQKWMRKLGSKKIASGTSESQKLSLACARRGVMGEGNLLPGGRRFGTKEETEKGRKEEGKLGGKVGR